MEDDVKFWEYLDSWILQCKKGNVRDVTLKKYYCTLESLKKIAPNVKISEIGRKEYQDIINAYAETHEKVTTTDFHHHLKACLEEATECKIISKNPANRAIMKGKEEKEKSPKYLSQFEAQLLVRSSKVFFDY